MNVGLLLTAFALLQIVVLRRLRFDWLLIGIVLVGSALCVTYLTYTSITERNYDGEAHLEYVQAIAANGRLPNVSSCAMCGHPPLYYALAAIWLKVGTAGLPLEAWLQCLSLLLFFAFVVVASLVARSALDGAAPAALATALVVFWPSSIINSVRLHNDALAAPLMLASIYFLAQWDRGRRERDFGASLAFASLALLTKSNGYAVAATLLVFVALGLRSHEHWRRSLLRSSVAAVVLSVAGLGVIAIREARDDGTWCQKVLGHACDGRYVPPVPDTLARFLSFQPKELVEPLSAFREEPAREPFSNRFLRSSLFGTMPLGDELGTPRHRLLASVMSVLFLLMTAALALCAPFQGGVRWQRYRVYLVASLVLFAFLVAFRLRVPNEFHEDFRHMFPALVPFCVGFVATARHLGRRFRWVFPVAVTMALTLIASSIGFFVCSR